MAGEPLLTGGELNAAITSALVGIHTAHMGRGPSRAYTFHNDQVIVTIMHEVLAPAERALGDSPHAPAIITTRQLFQQMMQPEFVDAVERLTGRTVTAFVSGNHLTPDVAVETFILDGLPGGAARRPAT